MKFTVLALLAAIYFSGCGNPSGSKNRTPDGGAVRLNAAHHDHYHVHGREIIHSHEHPDGFVGGHRHPHNHLPTTPVTTSLEETSE